jgi:tetratricopeptide (TPR) repeat protein
MNAEKPSCRPRRPAREEGAVATAEALRLDPNYADAWAERALAFTYQGEYAKAIADATEAIRLDPKDAYPRDVRGTADALHWEHFLAVIDYSEAIHLDPKDDYAFRNRGNCYFLLQQTDKAILDYSEAIRLDPKEAAAYRLRGTVHSLRNEYADAFKDFAEAIRLNPADVGTYVNRGMAFYSKKEYDKALSDFTEAIRLSPKDLNPLNNAALLLATCPIDGIRDGNKAVELATRACELTDWKNGSCLACLAAAHAECQDFKEAVKWQKRALEVSQDNKDGKELGLKRLRLYEKGKPVRVDVPDGVAPVLSM